MAKLSLDDPDEWKIKPNRAERRKRARAIKTMIGKGKKYHNERKEKLK